MKIDSETMTLNENAGVHYLTYNKLSDIDFINHAFSTRLGGVSEGIFESMNLSFEHDDFDKVTENYKRMCKACGFDFRRASLLRALGQRLSRDQDRLSTS